MLKAAPEDDEVHERASEESEMQQEVSLMNVFHLPQEVQGVIFSHTGMSVMSHIASACQAGYSSIWISPITWSTIVVSLGLVPQEGASAQSLQSTVRRTLYGIDHLCRHSFGKHGRSIVRRDQGNLLQQAMRACSGLSFEDGAEITDQVIGHCLELLVSFNVDEAQARCDAKQLTSVVSRRTDVFNHEQVHKVETAFSDAMDLHQLLGDVMMAPAVREMVLDEALMPPFGASFGDEDEVLCGLQVQDGSGCCQEIDAALDRLISVLRDVVVEASPVR